MGLSKNLFGKNEHFDGPKMGRAEEFARATGRPLYYKNPDNFLFDKKGKLYTGEISKSAIVIEVDYEGNKI